MSRDRRALLSGLALLSWLVLALAGVPGGARASVRFEDWRSTSLEELADRAARERKLIVLVITQPDWCPPCIKLDRKWLKNAGDTEVAQLTRDALVAEILGYDQPEAGLLAKHGLEFRGTPTTLVLAPEVAGRRLGEARRAGSIVGAPDDFPARLRAILQGADPVAEAKARVEALAASDGVARATALLELGDALASRGEADGADATYRQVEGLASGGLEAPAARELAELKRAAAWRRADTVTLRVRKNYRRALEEIEAFEGSHRSSPAQRADVAYAKAWALTNLGRVEEALAVLEKGLPDDADGAETFLYFCFRSGAGEALRSGERRVAEAMQRWPERLAAWHEARGRIERRQGRLEDALGSFERAVALEKDDATRLVYEGQAEHVRAELASRVAPGRP